MTQPNEQLIEAKQINVTVSELPGCVVQELEEYLGEAFDEHELDSDHMHTFQALVIGYHAAWEEIERLLDENKRLKAVNDRFANSAAERIESLESQLQQTREELEQTKEQLSIADTHVQNLSVEIEQVKAERDGANKAYEIRGRKYNDLLGELAAKDKVLEWYATQAVYFGHAGDIARATRDRGKRARDILTSYPPREKGADNEQR